MTTLVRLLKLMAPFRWWILAGVLLSFATTGASVGLMAVSAYLISKAALARDMTDLAVWITEVIGDQGLARRLRRVRRCRTAVKVVRARLEQLSKAITSPDQE